MSNNKGINAIVFNRLSNISVFVIPICCIVASLIVFMKNNHNGYFLLFLMPIAYMICFLGVFRRRIFNCKSLFVTSFASICFLRYVVLPLLIVFSGLYGGRSSIPPKNSSYTSAIILMMYELFCVSVVICFKYKTGVKLTPNSSLEKTKFRGDEKLIYLSLFLGTIFMTILRPSCLLRFSFITSSTTGAEYLESPTGIDSICLYLLFTSKIIIYVLLQLHLRDKFYRTHNYIYKILSYLLLMLNICVFYGMNRMDLIIPTIASVIFEIQLFGEKKYGKYILVATVLLIVVSNISSARNLASYSRSFIGRYDKLTDITDVFQGYLGGPYNVAISIESVSYYPEVRNIFRLLFDIFRPMIGINIFLKNSTMIMSNAFFNRRIWLSDFSSQIIPMVGQGFMHLGSIFSPLLSCCVAIIAGKLETYSCNTKSSIMRYVVLICIIRCGMLMGQGISNIVNELSMDLLLTSLVVWATNHTRIGGVKSCYEENC